MWREPGSVEQELSLFASKVAELNSRGSPVKIYPGCGDTIAAGFLNIDRKLHPRLKPDDKRWKNCDIFIFPFANMAWPLADDSCDYIFHEDLFEHLSQREQIGFLAETLRVLKRNEFHRVNTPSVVESMRRHSRFTEGFKGVYFQEWDQHGHVSIVSQSSLTEMAKLVGYREVFFNLRNRGLSAHRYADCRPGPDRDPTFGNLFADLLK
jgi:predicted SAM-dependent methyltransferase